MITISDISRQHKISYKHLLNVCAMRYEDYLLDSKMRFFLKNFNPKQGEIVLDVGCFIGVLTFRLAKKYPNVTFVGIDTNKTFIDFAKEMYYLPNLSFFQYDVDQYPITWTNEINHIIFLETIEHVDNPSEFLRLFHALLKHDAMLYLSTPSALGITNILYNLKHQKLSFIDSEEQNTGSEKDHLYVWDKITLYRLLFRNGFRHYKHFISRKLNIFRGQSICLIVKKQ